MDLEQQVTVDVKSTGTSIQGSQLKRYVLECKKVDISIKKTSILQQIDGAFIPGQLTALMGPSGSGKTTLMNSMSGRGLGEVVSGEILVNGKKMSKRSIRTISCLVPQLDVLFAVLTARETLNYTARLALTDLTIEERKQRVQDVVESLSLQDVQDVLVGNEDIKGLSGGERKRVSIGMEMITNPSVMFLDEPTSGLDAKIAKDVVELLKKLSADRTVICTIHQPSFPVFSLFDKLLLLSKGRMVYNGDVDAVSKYFEHIDIPVPTFSNPADHMLEVISEMSLSKPFHQVFQESEENKAFVGFALEASELAKRLGDDGPKTDLTRKEKRLAIKAKHEAACSSWFNQFRVLFSRAFYIGFKDKGQFRMRLFQSLLIGVVVGALYWDLANTQVTRFDRQSVLFVLTLFTLMGSMMSTVVTLPLEKAMVKREYNNGYFYMSAYFFARIAVLYLFQTFFNCIVVAIIYPSVQFTPEWENVVVFFVTIGVLSYLAISLGYLFGTIFPNVTAATQTIPSLLLPMVFFSGLFIAPENIPSYFIWLYYLSFLQYPYTVLVVNEFKDRNFEPCTPQQIATPGACPFGPCNANPFNASIPAESCSGVLVIDSLGYDVDLQLINFLILVAFWVVTVVAGAWVFRRFLNKSG